MATARAAVGEAQPVSQMVFVKRSLKDPDELHELQAQGLLRASFTPASGGFAGLGFAPSTRAATLSSSSLMCDPLDPSCTVGEVLAILQKASDVPAMEHVGFALVTAAGGHREGWAGVVLERASRAREVGYVAAAHILGTGPFNGLVEVMSDDREAMLRTLLALTDVPGVVDAQFGFGRAEHTRGFGTKAHEH